MTEETIKLGRRNKGWSVEIEEPDGTRTTISGRYAGPMDLALSLVEADSRPDIFEALLQKEVFQRCITTHSFFSDVSDTHATTGEGYDENNPKHWLIGELEPAAQRELLWLIAPALKEAGRQGGEEARLGGQATADKFLDGQPPENNEDSQSKRPAPPQTG